MNDVVEAWAGIARAEEHYRETLRAAIASGASQTEISKALNRTREMLRRDVMTPQQREELRRADAEKKRHIREAAKAASTTS